MIKVLYVEDEPFLAKIVKETLVGRNFCVTHVPDGEQAIEIFNETDPDICILDIMLPKKNGYQVAQYIRASDPDIPILFLTAKDQTDDLVKGFESGGNDYIRKPFSLEELIVRLHNLLKLVNIKTSVSEKIAIGSQIQFSPANLTVHTHNEDITLSHKESQILTLLCHHQNQVIERKMILMSVWNDDSYYNSRTLDVYMRKLRKLLSVDPSIQIITLKGVGYRFNV